ncbi:SH3 domain-binding glutamic acid-rich-like protein 2 [Pseudopipra pipra]|uniref:SH3 domain-binding glutamic acid-rich-like protein 2 n=1 Tax=Pseudopipra pipra TaxID=415032 RepID=UPI0031393B0A
MGLQHRQRQRAGLPAPVRVKPALKGACLDRDTCPERLHFPPLCRSKRRPAGPDRAPVEQSWQLRTGQEDQEQPELHQVVPGSEHSSRGRAGCRSSPFPWQAGAGRLPPTPVLRLSPPGQDYSARRSLRAAPTFPPLAAIACLLPAGSRTRLTEGGCGRRAGQGRAGRGGAGVLRAVAALGGGGGVEPGGPGPVRAGERLPQPLCPVPPAPAAAADEVKMVIRVFVASSSGSVAIKKRQQDVVRFLEANRIEFEEVDITMSEEKRQWMYKNIPEDRQPAQGNPLPPQIFSDDRYCGDYDGFFESKESNTVFSFLGLKPTLASKASEP